MLNFALSLNVLTRWGVIPHVEALRQLPDYQGFYVLEIRPRFYEHLAEALSTARDLIRQAA